MSKRNSLKAQGLYILLSGLWVTLTPAEAGESFRIPRPSESDKQVIKTTFSAPARADFQPLGSNSDTNSTLPARTNATPGNGLPLQANATLDADNQLQNFQNTISQWQNKNFVLLQSRNNATIDGDPYHKGLTSHIGGALFVLGKGVSTAAGVRVPITNVKYNPNAEPKIEIVTGHCPAAFDPAFQIPKTWWTDLAREESDERLGPQWKLWMDTVKTVLQSHAYELRQSPGVSSLHVVINPNGTISNVTPYTGAERGNSGIPISQRTMQNLRQILLSIGRLPPFPSGSNVPCYHLIFNGSAGI